MADMTIDEYIALIDEASVYDVASETPLELASNLSARLGNRGPPGRLDAAERIATTGNQTFDRQLGSEMLVEKGLRGRLKPGSLLTGQLYIDLDIYPDDSPRKIVYGGKYPEVPTIPTPIREITRGITKIVDKLEKLPLEQIGNELRDTMEQSQATLVKLDRFLDAESPTGHELKRVLTELADAARNISVLADYLGRHPESLVFGKDKRNEK